MEIAEDLLYSAESFFQRLHVRLDPRIARRFPMQTNLVPLFDTVKARFSGTNPALLVEVQCDDVPSLIATQTLRGYLARLCGPELFSFLSKHDFYFETKETFTLDIREAKTWSVIWYEQQVKIARQKVDAPLPENVRSLFARR